MKQVPRILTTVPDLKEISISAISTSLLSHVDIPCFIRRREAKYYWQNYMDSRINNSTKKLPLPKLCIEQIEKKILRICEEIEHWVAYHHRTIFLSSGSEYDLFCLVSYFVWYPNGTINYKQTALHLQSSLRLSDVQKFRLLCTYCLKEEIEQKWPALFENDAFDRLDFDEYLLIQYWSSYCRNALDKILIRNRNGMSLDSYLFRNEQVDNWHAKEYFFDRMNVEEKLQNAVSMLDVEEFGFYKEMLTNLNETQRIQVYLEKPAQVIHNLIENDSAEDASSAWFEIRDLINPEQFVTIIRKLCASYCGESFITGVWRSASTEMKLSLFSSDNDPYFKMFWDRCIRSCDIQKYKKFFDTNEDIKKALREKDVFIQNCSQLIARQELPQLKTLLNFCFPNSEELTQFKHNHIHQSRWFRSHCEEFASARYYYSYSYHNIPQEHLERVCDFCFCDREEFIRFGKDFTNRSWFYDRCQDFISHNNMSKLNQLINAFLPEAEDRYQFNQLLTNRNWFSDHCKYLVSNRRSSTLNEMLNSFLPRPEDLFQFKQAFAEKVYTMSFLKTSVLTNQKLHCTSAAHLLKELIDLFPYPADKFAQLKICITREDFFLEHCRNLILNKNLDDLQKEFEFFFDTLEQSASFRKKLIGDGPSFFNNCLNIVRGCDFSLSKLEKLMDLITFDSTTVISLSTIRSINQFKKTTIFSSRYIVILRELVESNRFNEVKKLFNKLLHLEKDKNELRLILFSKPDELVKKFFFEYDESACKSWMEWWFSDKDSLQKCKRKLSVDSIFEEEFKKCVFQTYDESGRVSHCTLNKDFEFGALDRFLKWRFGSAKEVKEYKLRRIDEYENIETINVLVKKGCHASYFKKLTAFFFDNDSEEIAKFKKKHKGERIAEMVKKVRVNYFEH